MRNSIQDFEYFWLLTHQLQELKRQHKDAAWWLEPRQRPLETRWTEFERFGQLAAIPLPLWLEKKQGEQAFLERGE